MRPGMPCLWTCARIPCRNGRPFRVNHVAATDVLRTKTRAEVLMPSDRAACPVPQAVGDQARCV